MESEQSTRIDAKHAKSEQNEIKEILINMIKNGTGQYLDQDTGSDGKAKAYNRLDAISLFVNICKNDNQNILIGNTQDGKTLSDSLLTEINLSFPLYHTDNVE